MTTGINSPMLSSIYLAWVSGEMSGLFLMGLALQTAPDVFQQLPLLPFCFLDNDDLVSVDVVGDGVTNHLMQNVRPDGNHH